LILIAVMAAPQVWAAWKYDPAAPENVKYYGVPTKVKVEYAFYYLVLVAFLAVMTHDVHEMLGSARAVSAGTS
jgi:hypothetical protein